MGIAESASPAPRYPSLDEKRSGRAERTRQCVHAAPFSKRLPGCASAGERSLPIDVAGRPGFKELPGERCRAPGTRPVRIHVRPRSTAPRGGRESLIGHRRARPATMKIQREALDFHGLQSRWTESPQPANATKNAAFSKSSIGANSPDKACVAPARMNTLLQQLRPDGHRCHRGGEHESCARLVQLTQHPTAAPSDFARR